MKFIQHISNNIISHPPWKGCFLVNCGHQASPDFVLPTGGPVNQQGNLQPTGPTNGNKILKLTIHLPLADMLFEHPWNLTWNILTMQVSGEENSLKMTTIIFLDLHRMLGKKVHNIMPNGGLMVIYQGFFMAGQPNPPLTYPPPKYGFNSQPY